MIDYNVVLLEWHSFKRIENYSLGLFYIQENLKKNGINVKTLILDEKTCAETVELILTYAPDMVAIKFYSETEKENSMIAKLLKEKQPNIKIVFGGHTASIYSTLLLTKNPYIDVITRNESEETCVELCQCLINNTSLQSCRGITYRKGDTFFKSSDRPLIQSLEELKMPEKSLFLDDKQKNIIYYALSSARGCVGNCYFCSANNMYKGKQKQRWRGISSDSIVKDLKKLQEEYPNRLKFVKFLDSSIEDPNPKTKERLRMVVQGIEENKLDIAYSFFTRAESWNEDNEELIIRMKKTGLYKVFMGFDESIQLYDIRKFTGNAIVKEKQLACKLFQKHGIRTVCYMILFHPFITIEDLINCTLFLEEINGTTYPDVWTHKVVLYPDSRLFQSVTHAGLLLKGSDNEYSFDYAYEDGRVKKVRDVMSMIESLDSFSKLRSILIKTDLALDICDAWKERNESLIKMQASVHNYTENMERIYKEVGTGQKELFLCLLKNVQNREVLDADEKVSQWNCLFEKSIKELEMEWFKLQMHLLRNHVSLLQ